MKRRSLLAMAGTGSAALAGCLTGQSKQNHSNEGASDPNAETNRSIDRPVCYDEVIYEFNVVENITEEMAITEGGLHSWSPDKAIPPVPSLIRQLTNGGIETVEISHIPPLETLPYFHKDNKIYEFNTIVKDSGEITAPNYSVNQSPGAVEEGETTYSFSDLPQHDQWRLYEGLSSVRNQCFAGYLDSGDEAESVLNNGEERLSIDFAGYNEFIDHSEFGRYYSVELDDTKSIGVKQFQYSVDIVVESEGSFEDYFIEDYRYATRLTNLSDNVTEIVEDAIEDKVRICVAGKEDEELENAHNELENMLGELTETKIINASRFRRYFPKYIKYKKHWYEMKMERIPVQ